MVEIDKANYISVPYFKVIPMQKWNHSFYLLPLVNTCKEASRNFQKLTRLIVF